MDASTTAPDSFDRALFLACGRNMRLYSARRAGFATVEAHVAAKAAEQAARAAVVAAERAAEAAARRASAAARRAANPEQRVNLCFSDLGGCAPLRAFEVSERDVFAMFDASAAELGNDRLYVRGTDGRVRRAL